jgi:hypothetical protein
MTSRRQRWAWAGTVTAALTLGASPVVAQPALPATSVAAEVPVRVPLEEVPAGVRERMRAIVDKPSLMAHGPEEIFHCHPPTYHWLLEHPDQAARLWRLLNVGCADIRAADAGAFSWQDGHGGHVRWETVLHSPAFHVWFAEGQVKPGIFLPMASFCAVLVVQHTETTDGRGRPAMRQRMTLYLHTDSQAAALAARIVGASAPRMAEQYVGQVQTFFGTLAAYLFQHPEHARALSAQLQRPAATDAPIPPPSANPPVSGWEGTTGSP